MEDTHGDINFYSMKGTAYSLNPYYNGRYSWSNPLLIFTEKKDSLNPYYNGRYSWRVRTHISLKTK